MRLANRLKDATTATDTTAINLTGSAPAGYRTLAQVIACGEMAVGESNVPFFVEDTAGNWECGFYTIVSGTQLTRDRVVASSNNNLAVTFPAGTKAVFNSPPATQLHNGLVNPYDPGYDIIICAGQSNMVGQDAIVANFDTSHPDVYVFNAYPYEASTYQKITVATDPLRHNYSQTTGVPAQWSGSGMGPGIWFGRTYKSNNPGNRKVLLVPVARSATHLVTNTPGWAPGDGTAATGAALYENAIAQGNAALAAAKLVYPASRIVGTIWLQGENDAQYNASQSSYATGLKALIQGFRNRLTDAQKSWFVILGMCGDFATDSTNFPGYVTVDQAHRQVALETPGCGYVPGPVGAAYLISGYPVVANNPHYSALGIRQLANAAAAKVADAVLNRGVDTTPPTITRATVLATNTSTVYVTLSEPVDPNYAPIAANWTVGGHTVTGAYLVAGGSNNTIALTLSAPFVYGEAARTVALTVAGNIRDLAGNQMQPGSFSVTNNAPASPTVSAVTVAPSTASVAGSATQQFSATVTGTGSPAQTVTWSATAGTIDASGLFTAPAATGSTQTITITATSTVDATKSGTATVTVAATGAATVTSVAVSPSTANVAGAGTQQFTATVTGTNSPAQTVTWSTTAGTISSAGLFTAPAATGSVQTITVTATSTVDGTKSGTATVTVAASGTPTVSSVTVSPSTANVSGGGTQQFSASVAGTNSPAQTVTWSVSPAGTINSSGLLTAPAATSSAQTLTVTATSTVDTGKSGTATVTVAATGGVSTDLQFTDLQLMTDMSSGAPSNPVPPYSYKMNNAVNYSATPQGATSSKALAGDGTFTVKIATVAARQFLGLKAGATTVAYGSLSVLFMAETTGYKMYYPDSNTTTYVTGRIPLENDLVRMTRSGTNITYAVSSDNGATWTDIAKQASVSGTKYLQILAQGNGQFINPVGTGWA